MNLDELKEKFDTVVLKHHIKDTNDPRTVAAIVDGGNVFIGVARCYETDQFNRPLGRTIAIGRALREHNRHTKKLPYRKSELRREASQYSPLSYVAVSHEDYSIDDILKNSVFG